MHHIKPRSHLGDDLAENLIALCVKCHQSNLSSLTKVSEVAFGKELLRDYINATVEFPKFAAHTKLHVKTLHQMFGPKRKSDRHKSF